MPTNSTHPPVRSFKDLIVWQRARQLAGAVRTLTDGFSTRGQYVMADQILRAATSVAGNIAEGRGRLSKADNVRHLLIARGSLNELVSHLELAAEFGFVDVEATRNAHDLTDEVGRMLNAQIRTLGGRRMK